MWRLDVRPPSDSEKRQTKARVRIAPRGHYDFCDDVGMLLICPTGQARGEEKISARIEER
jgi:hypothetical protein